MPTVAGDRRPPGVDDVALAAFTAAALGFISSFA
eukprot:CAMPEP_0174987630 /NCGR_PEP_ID=MMETSP0004_2-20121128/19659_1 /TAXON_ID=420556 /ORGANISM="Ochromonas sp., Strain CCMP1393" /LENGTH=33 /DNA_ID= /DNA_START= /DNA_END= /DNA_ORIENTATION=